MSKLLFRIETTTQSIKIYTDGEVEGMGREFKVVNYFPAIAAEIDGAMILTVKKLEDTFHDICWGKDNN